MAMLSPALMVTVSLAFTRSTLEPVTLPVVALVVILQDMLLNAFNAVVAELEADCAALCAALAEELAALAELLAA